MHKRLDTFCPTKWDELNINFQFGYVYACCKAAPELSVDYINALRNQKQNLLNGIQDPSCKYCWDLENQGKLSLRTEQLAKFTGDRAEYSVDRVKPKIVLLSVGNACNFQCTYCNPKFSSKWEIDVKQSPYRVFTDRFFYAFDNKLINRQLSENLEVLNHFGQVENLHIIGGEPLQNNEFWKIIETADTKAIAMATNLSCSKEELDRLLAFSSKFDRMTINVSLDSTGANAEFTRFGMNFNVITENIKYLLEHKPENVNITILSLMTSITVRDIDPLINFVLKYKNIDQSLKWQLAYCSTPRIQSFETLPAQYRSAAISALARIKELPNTTGVESVISAIETAKFSNTMYKELKMFLKEFADRKGIEIPVCLD